MTSSWPIRLTLTFATSVALVLSFMWAQLELERQGHRLPSAWFDELQLMPASRQRVFWLQYDTFAADISWIALVVNYGQGKRVWVRFSNLEHNARVVQELDPRFYKIYDWFPAVHLVFRWPQRFEDAEVATSFVRRGFDVFPTDFELPFHAAMSYIGVQDPPDGPRRRYERIIELAELAAIRGDPDAAGVLPFYQAKLSGGDSAESREAEAEFLVKLFARATSDRERNQIREQLTRLLRDPKIAADRLGRSDAFHKQHQATAAYLSPELYTLTYR